MAEVVGPEPEFQYHTPANVEDFTGEQLQKWQESWSEFVLGTLRNMVKPDQELKKEGVVPLGVGAWAGSGVPKDYTLQWFVEKDAPTATGQLERKVTWNGFPERLLQKYGPEHMMTAFKVADTEPAPRTHGRARDMDEYLEWYVYRDEAGSITRVDFTCEAPEYYQQLFLFDKDKVLQLYRQYVSPEVCLSDLVDPEGNYNIYNRWNTFGGIMHLNCPPNSLVAETYLGSSSTVLRRCGKHVRVLPAQIIACSQMGLHTRNSDPTVGYTVNSLAFAGAEVSLRNPIALYIDSVDLTGLTLRRRDDGTERAFPVDECFKLLRGDLAKGEGLRFSITIPPGESLLLGGEEVLFGAQLSTVVTMQLTGIARFLDPKPQPAANSTGCEGDDDDGKQAADGDGPEGAPVYGVTPGTKIDVDDIQGDMLLGFNKKHLQIMCLNFTSGRDGARAFVVHLQEQGYITSAREVLEFRKKYRQDPGADHWDAVWSQVSFSNRGLRKLADVRLGSFPAAFRLGLQARSLLLGDPAEGPGSRSSWLPAFAEATPDMMIQVAADKRVSLDVRVKELAAMAAASGVDLVYSEHGNRDPGHPTETITREQFGFHDGISNPQIRGYYEDSGEKVDIRRRLLKKEKLRETYGKPGSHLMQPGELLVGHVTEVQAQFHFSRGGKLTEEWMTKAGTTGYMPAWAKNGSFTAFRILQQDVPAFWNFAHSLAEQGQANAHKFPGVGLEQMTDTWAAANMVGRWPSGCPLALSPAEDVTALGMDTVWNNGFSYGKVLGGGPGAPELASGEARPEAYPKIVGDPLGFSCPFGSHLRRMNPRDTGTDHGVQAHTLQHRIIRRGAPYGPRLPESQKYTGDGQERGLLFIGYQRSLEQSFEFLQKQWANPGSSPFGGIDGVPGGSNAIGNDMLIGQHYPGTGGVQGPAQERTAVIGTAQGQVSATTSDVFVTPRGGGYFFVPSLTALRLLAPLVEQQHPLAAMALPTGRFRRV